MLSLRTVGHFVRDNALALAFVVSFALLCTHLSMRVNAGNMPALYQSEFDTLRGHPRHPEFQNRVLAPAILWSLRSLVPAAISDKSVWFILRLLQAIVAFVALYSVAFALTGGRLRALAAVTMATYLYCWTPFSQSENTSDFFDILFTSLFVGLTLANRPILLGIAVAIAAANRESAAFAGLIWIGIAAARYGLWPEQWRRFAPGVALMALATGVALGLRYWLGGAIHSQQIGMLELFQSPGWMLYPDGAMPMLLAMTLAMVAVLVGLPRPWTVDQKGLLAAAIMCAAVTFFFGIAGELRVWLPCCTIVSLLAVSGANGKSDSQWTASFFSR